MSSRDDLVEHVARVLEEADPQGDESAVAEVAAAAMYEYLAQPETEERMMRAADDVWAGWVDASGLRAALAAARTGDTT